MVLGSYKKIVSAKTTNNEIFKYAQDGGIISSLLIYALEERMIDGALVAGNPDNDWVPVPEIATTPDEILAAAGTKYTMCPSINAIKEVVNECNLKNIAAVLTPCQCQVVRKAHKYPMSIGSFVESISLLFGVFCMRTFSHKAISELAEDLGTDLQDVERMNIAHGHFYFNSWDEGLKVPLKDIHGLEQPGCDVCKDYSSLFADLAIGTAGSPPSYSTVVIRTQKGLELFDSAVEVGLLEYDSIEDVTPGLSLLEIRGETKEHQANREINKRKEEGMFVPIRF
ncbi:MAG: Coenzyme F420 hydrogenase/dehydrogenase, beta subunit C-terminal domain [Methanobrevibacter sp.]|uniref:Coenzyme F420 hydrogenase/dehydrogenase, beta subunit C-terminal domain n=1 Tax=Methanobrevibacter sp. TaxID=66852 RepID=UPI0026E0479A|nr:Coenzyme F420 hydrogenase/dehydrogenase, beta subunit C-terminal domain [Methanobrevibacter sp.]MDO5848032.1 Coenzyme F420 hydrogenase/dehydrogenase, beta subunit C-terminal domain [Methanobrevibacter sp.]